MKILELLLIADDWQDNISSVWKTIKPITAEVLGNAIKQYSPTIHNVISPWLGKSSNINAPNDTIRIKRRWLLGTVSGT
jgi:hypothetical protein